MCPDGRYGAWLQVPKHESSSVMGSSLKLGYVDYVHIHVYILVKIYIQKDMLYMGSGLGP